MRDGPSEQLPFRATLLAVLALAAAPAVGLGIARFAYALVLPDMQRDFGWTYAQAGLPNAFNALGYLVGAVIAGRVAGRFGAFRSVAASTVIAALATLLSAFALGLWSLSALRFVSGAAAALAFVAGGAVAIGLGQRTPGRSALIVALFYVGPPIGIILSALTILAADALPADVAWRGAWGALGLVSIALATLLAAPPLRAAQPPRTRGAGERAPLRPMAALLAAYMLFGAGYIGYMTFMIAFLRDGGAPLGAQVAFWCAIGVAGVVSPAIWGGTLQRLASGRAFALAVAVTTLGAAIPLAGRSIVVELVSGLVFGSAFFTVVAATTVHVRRALPPAAWASGVGAMTVAFSLGQVVGPVVTGAVTDLFGGLDAGLAVGAALLAASGVLALLQRGPGR